MAEVLIELVTGEKKLELTGSWPTVMDTTKDVSEPIVAR
jgi:hypothetical protein